MLLLTFDVNKIPQLAKSFGRAQGASLYNTNFDKAQIEMPREVDRIKTGEASELAKPTIYSRKINQRPVI